MLESVRKARSRKAAQCKNGQTLEQGSPKSPMTRKHLLLMIKVLNAAQTGGDPFKPRHDSAQEGRGAGLPVGGAATWETGVALARICGPSASVISLLDIYPKKVCAPPNWR